jgi:hypothetical protein
MHQAGDQLSGLMSVSTACGDCGHTELESEIRVRSRLVKLLSFQLLLCTDDLGYICYVTECQMCTVTHLHARYEAKIKTAKHLHRATNDSGQEISQPHAFVHSTTGHYLGPANGRPPMLTFARGGPMPLPLRMSLATSGVPVFGAWASGCGVVDVV